MILSFFIIKVLLYKCNNFKVGEFYENKISKSKKHDVFWR